MDIWVQADMDRKNEKWQSVNLQAVEIFFFPFIACFYFNCNITLNLYYTQYNKDNFKLFEKQFEAILKQ